MAKGIYGEKVEHCFKRDRVTTFGADLSLGTAYGGAATLSWPVDYGYDPDAMIIRTMAGGDEDPFVARYMKGRMR